LAPLSFPVPEENLPIQCFPARGMICSMHRACPRELHRAWLSCFDGLRWCVAEAFPMQVFVACQ